MELSKRKRAVKHFMTTKGGELRSLGFDGTVESWTFDFIILDDLLTDPMAIRNPNRRQLAYSDLQTKFLSRINPVGVTKFAFIGSRRHSNDLQGQLLETNRNVAEVDRWHYHHAPAILHEHTDHEEALWPTSKEFSLEGLRAIRDRKIADGAGWEWSCLFQNEAMASPDLLSFDPKWFDEREMFYPADTPVETLPEAKFRIMSCDPSMGAGNATNDYFSSLYLHIAHDGTIFIDDSFLAVGKPDYLIPMTAGLIERHQDVQIFVLEANSGGLYVGELLKRSCDEKRLRCPIVLKTWTSRSEDEKISRITLALFEPLSHGKVKLRDTPMNRILFRQLRGFPTEKLDGPDSLATGMIVLLEMLNPARKGK